MHCLPTRFGAARKLTTKCHTRLKASLKKLGSVLSREQCLTVTPFPLCQLLQDINFCIAKTYCQYDNNNNEILM